MNKGSDWPTTGMYYASIAYGDDMLGLLVEAEDELQAQEAAEETCTAYGSRARVISLNRIVLQ